MTVMQHWIRFWFRRNDREFEEEAERERELDKECGIPPDVLALCARLDQERHERNQFPVGAFFDSIDPKRHGDQKASAEQLFVVAEVGKELLYEAICTADEDDNEEFFVRAYEYWGPLVDTVLQECDREYRNSSTGCRLQSQRGRRYR